MAISSNATVITTAGTGDSAFVTLPADHWYSVFVEWAGGAGDFDLQAGNGTTFEDVLDAANGSVVNVTTAGMVCMVPGGLSYQADVNTHTSVATISFHKGPRG